MFISKNIIFKDAVIIDLWYFYGEQNKSRWEGGKKINIFSKKGFLRGGAYCCQGGDPKSFFCVLMPANCAPPKQKPSYAPAWQFNDLYNLLNPVPVLTILQICDWFYIFLKLLGKGCFLSKYLVSKHKYLFVHKQLFIILS